MMLSYQTLPIQLCCATKHMHMFIVVAPTGQFDTSCIVANSPSESITPAGRPLASVRICWLPVATNKYAV